MLLTPPPMFALPAVVLVADWNAAAHTADPSTATPPEGTPWWAYLILSVLALVIPVLAPKVAERAKKDKEPPTPPAASPPARATAPETAAADSEDEELRELRETLIQVLQDLQAKSREAARLAADLAEARRTAEQLQRTIDALIARREQTPQRWEPPPSSFPG